MPEINFGALSFLAVEILFVAGLTLLLFRARHKISLGPLYVFIGTNQYLSVVLASTVYVSVSPDMAISPGSVVLFSASLFAILLVYLRTDIPTARGLIYGVVLANTTLVAMLWLTRYQLGAFESRNLLNVPIELFAVQPRIYLTGTAVLLVDFFLVVILYEFLLLKAGHVPRLLRTVLTMLGVLYFDAVVFSVLAFYGQPNFMSVLEGQLFGKTFAGIIYGVVLYLYLTLTEPLRREKTSGATHGLEDVFSIFTYRERYRQVKQQLEIAEAANLAKSRFLANMSHELRTPLNAIIGFTTVALGRRTDDDENRRFLMRVLANGKHLLELINGLLDLSKIESGRNVLHITDVHLKELLQETVDQLQGEALQRELDLQIEIPDDGLPLRTDRVRLKQVLINLIGNSLKFTDEGRVLARLTMDPVSGKPQRIDVLDSGIGISADNIGDIFTPFYQATPTARSAGGTGLGLAISRALCDQMGHSLQVTSEEGRGSQFSIVFLDGAQEAVDNRAA